MSKPEPIARAGALNIDQADELIRSNRMVIEELVRYANTQLESLDRLLAINDKLRGLPQDGE